MIILVDIDEKIKKRSERMINIFNAVKDEANIVQYHKRNNKVLIGNVKYL